LSPFGRDLIIQSSGFPKFAGWKNSVLLGQDFSLVPVEPTLVFRVVGSTGEVKAGLLGFLAIQLGCTGALALYASVQSVKAYLHAFSPVQPAYRNSLTSVEPVLCVISFTDSLDNCTSILVLIPSV